MVKRQFRLALVLILILLGSIAISARLASGNHSQSAPSLPTDLITARVAIATLASIPTYARALGTIEASNRVIIRSRVDGVILRVLFQEGELVAENAPLFEIDPTLYRIQVQQAEAALAKDQASLTRATKDLERGDELAGKGVLSRHDWDLLHATAAELQAAVASDRATLAGAQAQLDWTIIRAPIAGRVGKRLLDAGNLVHAAENIPMVDIIEMDPCNVIFAIPQEQLSPIRAMLATRDLPIEIRALDDRELLASAHSALLYNTVDRATGSIQLRAIVSNRDGRLWPGQSVNVRVNVVRTKEGVSVPGEAIFQASSGPAVYVVDDRNVVNLRSVKPGESDGDLVGIDSGVAAGEKVVISDQQRLAPDMRVVPEIASR
jgi:multidrug efflux system membrane fusion protein